MPDVDWEKVAESLDEFVALVADVRVRWFLDALAEGKY